MVTPKNTPNLARGLDQIRLIVSSWVFHLFFSGIVMLWVFLHPPTLFQGDFDTALNYLNTIVSSLSTILALCISIILVAIQLTASNYTHRVLDYFVRLPYNASLFSFYLVTILRSFFLMSYIKDDPTLGLHDTQIPPTLFGLQPVSVSLDLAMSSDIVMVAICFVSLLVYMYSVIQLLKPEQIIRLIVRDFDRAIHRGRWHNALESVEQICDIAKRAASVSDSLTGAQCVDVMSQVAVQLPLPKNRVDPFLQIHRTMVDQWVEIVGVAVKERETGLLRSVIDALYGQGTRYIEAESWVAAEMVLNAYRHLVFAHLLNDGQVFYVNRIAGKMYQLADLSVDRGACGQLICLQTWQIIRYVGECIFSSQPGFAVLLMEGMLMANEVPATLVTLSAQGQQSGLVSYFALWKAFASCASTRDVARWARWWAASVPSDVTGLQGRALALGLASHLKREDLEQTLRYTWNVPRSDMDGTLGQFDLGESAAELFDGWPWGYELS